MILKNNVLIGRISRGLVFFLAFFFSANVLEAQQSPNSRYVFEEDSPEAQKARDKQTEQIIKQDRIRDTEMDFQAPEVYYDQEKKVMRGAGGVIISREGVQLQADEAAANLESKEVQVKGDVVFTFPEGEVVAEQGELNMDSEVGSFKNATIGTEQRNFNISAEELYKDSEVDYRFFNTEFSTCTCDDDTVPWSIDCSRALIEDDGYAHTYNTTFNVNGFPVFYSPYFIVPVKRTRQSGLLAPTFGYSNRNGVQYQQPLYLVLDDYSDLTITPFIATQTRRGSSVGYRKTFSRKSSIDSRFYYSDESPRDGELKGTNIDNLFDPTFDEDRFGGFFKQNWRSESDVLIPTQIVSDIRYVSDDLFLREMQDNDVGDRSARFVTSQILAQSFIGGKIFGELSGEYNQAMEVDDDLIFQRLPQMSLSASESFRPFGFNPYGFKVITDITGSAIDFTRDRGYEGWRYDIDPSIRMPHHYQNYVSGELEIKMNQDFYSQSDELDPNTGAEVTGDERQVFQFAYTTSTAVERVFNLSEDSWLKYLAGLGTRSQTSELKRVKNVIEPFVQYAYVPEVEQDDLPFYDATDRIRERSLIKYGFRTSLQGKFVPTGSSQRIPELTPEISDIPIFDPDIGAGQNRNPRYGLESRGRVNEVAYLSVAQSYDLVEDEKDLDPGREPLSDIGFDLGFIPNSYFAYSFNGNLDAENQDMSSWGMGAQFKDDRGDALRGRFSYIENSVSQLDANLEIVLTDRLKLGLFGRFDDQESEFIESQVALRIQSACNCWYIDVGYTDTINPDNQQALFRFTLLGLGDVVQNFSLDDDVTTASTN